MTLKSQTSGVPTGTPSSARCQPLVTVHSLLSSNSILAVILFVHTLSDLIHKDVYSSLRSDADAEVQKLLPVPAYIIIITSGHLPQCTWYPHAEPFLRSLQQVVVALQLKDGRKTISGSKLRLKDSDHAEEHDVSDPAKLEAALEQHFGISVAS